MTKVKPSLPKGVRDFSPEMVAKRTYITKLISKTFESFGYMSLETPSIENLSTLTGKYGEEGDRLLFKILNSGDYLQKADKEALEDLDSGKLTPTISKKGLRYDLTVPLARFVAMNSHDLAFPFKRYQIQPVWRADRPQKGRFQEFFQCDADVLGSTSLLHEVEMVQMYAQVFDALKLPYQIKVNNRKILAAIAEVAGCANQLAEMTIALDKLDKTGKEGVRGELEKRGFSVDQISQIESLAYESDFDKLSQSLSNTEIGKLGIEELNYVRKHIESIGLKHVVFETTLARGLDYYTGTIYEVVCPDVAIGSIGGGGRYDDLTSIFGLPDVSGVGISFGLDRIYLALEELNLFPDSLQQVSELLFVVFDEAGFEYAFNALQAVRRAGINAELYPDITKMNKQMKYADRKHIPFVAICGEQEIEKNQFSLKNMSTGEQLLTSLEGLIDKVTS